MIAADRHKLARLETVLRDLDWREQLAVKELQRAGWGFTSIRAARDFLHRYREMAARKRAAEEITNRMLAEGAGWLERSKA